MRHVVEQGPDWSTVPAPGSRVLVTGAAGGLGRALSSVLAEVVAEVVGIDLPGTEATVTADLTDDDSARRAVAEAGERLGGLDALIGAAGVVDTIHRAKTLSPAAGHMTGQALRLDGGAALGQVGLPR
jgi:NAD(P)-dependent dehydrogenase (short-subunit alcohol dehydrogenase family)